MAEMSRKKRIICAVLCGVLLCIGGLTVWQWNNIGALLSAVRFSQEELEEKLEQNNQNIKDAVESIPNVSIRDVTQEEKEALKEGTLTQEELTQSLIRNEPKPDNKQPQKAEDAQAPQPEQQPPAEQSDYEKKLNELIAAIYVLREEFLIRLDETQAAAIADYKAIPPEQHNTKNVAALVSRYMSKGLAMEKECDAQIEQIVTEMEELLRENGGDLNIAQTVFDTYLEEKSLKKAWYMAELKKRGMI